MFFYLFVIRDKLRYVIVLGLIFLIIAAASDFAAIKLGWGLVGVAAATFFCFFLFSVVLIFLSGLLMLNCKLSEMVRLVLRLFIPYLYALLIFLPVNRFLHPVKDSFWLDALRGTAGCLIIFISYLPFWIRVDKETKLLTTLGKDLVVKFQKLKNLFKSK
jgi:hypothetical protein